MNERGIRIAILLSTYNGEQYLKAQMESILNQTLVQNIRLYIRDDGSNDKTLDIIKSYEDKLPIVVFQGENLGPAKSFWSLFINQQIRADYYAFCDQDDIWDNDKLERGIQAIQDFDGPRLWCSNCRVIDGEGKIVKEAYHEENPVFKLSAQFVCGSIQGCAMIWNEAFRNEIVQKDFRRFPMHDFVLITHAINMNCLIYDPIPIFSYRIHGRNYYAKEEKTSIRSIKASLRRWFSKNQRNCFSKYAKEFIKKNVLTVSKEEKDFINQIAGSCRNVIKRAKLIRSNLCVAEDERAIRAFKIKALLGIL